MKSILVCSLISLSTVTGACVDQVDDDSSIDGPTTDTPRLAANGMVPSQIQMTWLNSAALTSYAIQPYAGTADGRAYLAYLVSCALDSTQSITTGSYTFVGSLGIAPSWTSSALSATNSHWVSACMLARSNYSGTSVNLSMRGGHPQLYLSGEGGYNVQEGAYYGDIFFGTNSRNVCADVDVLNRPTYPTLKTRLCAHGDDGVGAPSMCGFIYAGTCASVCSFTSPNYTTCTDASGIPWTEVIKVNVSGN